MACSGARLGMRFSGTRIIPLASHQPRTRFISFQALAHLIIALKGNISKFRVSASAKHQKFLCIICEKITSTAQGPLPGATSTPPLPETVPGSTPSNSANFSDGSLPSGTDAADPFVIASSSASEISPLQFGDLAELGLAGWTPAGIIRWSLEILNVTTGMPWFYTIIAGSLLWRFALFPFTIMALRNSAKMLPISQELADLQKEAKELDPNDRLGRQLITLKTQSLHQRHGINPLHSLLAPIVQVTANIGFFFGVKKMCEFPVQQLTVSGVSILPDLTAADPTFILPILSAATVNALVTLSAKDMNFAQSPQLVHMPNGMKVLSVIFIPFMGHLPSGLWLALLTGTIFTTAQTFLLQQSVIRRALKIPQRVPQAMKPATMKQSWNALKPYVQKLIRRDDAARPSKRVIVPLKAPKKNAD
ncbi:60Kd inner membrane protein-domain-containing protein [Hygrophoropsis aurantiaca]|uniref:60Kd inner membrane protein-domain-containing protein n=1 Tax=Hygrophoropsis aurantiaca TaxID=72124 RepID=A0ACB8AF04_9AGAM|nr:60Kd inner membrane protein-domain-containing protein [Hygrophoropsis aurantiaca]